MNTITLEKLGFTKVLADYKEEHQLDSFSVGRVVLEHRDRYRVQTEGEEIDAELLGNLRYSAEERADLPVVGDWVALSEFDEGKGLIHAVYPRYSLLERQAVGRAAEKQIIAANIDVAIIVQSMNRDFSINRIERYLTLCYEAKLTPVVVLSKLDLLEDADRGEVLRLMEERLPDVSVFAISNATGEGIDALRNTLVSGRTYCLLGSSGVGKSTLLNQLTGANLMDTGEISERIGRGKHVTTHRELVVLPAGGVMIDNPGMREVGIADSDDGLAITFDLLYSLAEGCKYKDCSHVQEQGCAVLHALEKGELAEEVYDHYMKLEREQAHYSASVHEKRKREKRFGKMVKQSVEEKRRNRS